MVGNQGEATKSCISLCVFPLVCSFFLSLFLSFFRSFCLSVFPSFCLSVFLSFCLSVFLSFCLSVFLSFCLSVFLSFCLSVFLSFCLSVFLSFCLSVFLSFSFFRSLLLSFFFRSGFAYGNSEKSSVFCKTTKTSWRVFSSHAEEISLYRWKFRIDSGFAGKVDEVRKIRKTTPTHEAQKM